MKQKQSNKISLLSTLVLMGVVPLAVAAVIMIIVAASHIKKSVQSETFDKLKVAAQSVEQYFQKDINNGGTVNYDMYADHKFVECVQSENIELTLFENNTRFLTSLRNDDGSYNEGTKANDEVFEAVSRGGNYKSENVVINGIDYYVYYKPIYDSNNSFWGMAFAGTPQEKVKEAISSSVLSLIAISLSVAIIFAIIIILIVVKIKKSIAILSNSIIRISEGDISNAISEKDSIKEIDEMINASNHLQQKLDEVVGAVKAKANDLDISINAVNSAANESSDGSKQIAAAMDELSDSTMVLTEDVQSINSKAQAMGEYIQGIAQNVATLSSASDEIKDSTENAQELMNKVIESSEQSSHAVNAISESIELTNTSILKISEAIDLISEIAAQTNLLSLNASIEAARAGEAGKGFAVVAEEIGKLATESANTADIIRELANDMMTKSTSTVSSAKEIENIIKHEEDIIISAQSAFETLGASIEENLAMIEDINSKTEELTILKEGIISDMSDLSAISEENAASNQQVTASATSISEKVEEVSKKSDEMKETSAVLWQVVSYFS